MQRVDQPTQLKGPNTNLRYSVLFHYVCILLPKRWEVLISRSSVRLFLAKRFVKYIFEELSGGPEAVINVCGALLVQRISKSAKISISL